jgi:NAD(P)-dependent dehydrogenase (short-subunit alcohol dehydrogenase family)
MVQPQPADFAFPDQLDYPMQSIEGKAVLVTGGTTGIGRATALLLAARAARVMIFGRHEKELRDALGDLSREGREVHGLTADQASLDDVKKIFAEVDEKFGGLDILINNAGIAAEGVTDESLENIEYVLRSNLVGYLTCAKEAMKRMQRKGGHIVTIGSVAADKRGEGTVYVATKAGIQAMSESLAKEGRKNGIKVTLIEPGATGADMQPDKHTHEKRARQLKMLKAEDIAACVYFALTQPPRCDIAQMRAMPHLQDE